MMKVTEAGIIVLGDCVHFKSMTAQKALKYTAVIKIFNYSIVH